MEAANLVVWPPPHPSLDPVFSLNRLRLLPPSGRVTIHDAPLDSA